METVGEGIVTASADGKIVMVNAEVERVWGYGADELVGTELIHLMPERYRDEHRAGFERYLAGGDAKMVGRRVEVEGLRKDGSEFPLEIRISETQSAGEMFFTAAVRDITKRRQRQATLEESEERFRALFDSTFEGILIHENGVILDANESAAKNTGYDRDELIGAHVNLIHDEASGAAIEAAYEEQRASGAAIAGPFEIVGVAKDGTRADIEVLEKDLVYRGRAVRLSAFRDVTDRKQAERALRQRLEFEDLLAAISTRFINLEPEEVNAEIMKALGEIGEFAGADRSYVLVFDAGDGDIEHAYEWCRDGIPPHGKPGDWPEDRPPRLTDFLSERTVGRLTADGVVTMESVPDLPDEDALDRVRLQKSGVQSVVLVPITARRRLIGFAGFDMVREKMAWDTETVRLLRLVGDIFTNAIGSKTAQEELRRAHEGLERKVEERTTALRQKQAQLIQSEKMASLGNLVAGVAHEVNTPLGAIKSNNHTLIASLEKLHEVLSGETTPREVRVDPKLEKILAMVDKLNAVNREAIERIVRIVSSLRKFARLDEAEEDTVDVHAGLESTLTLVHHQLKGRIEVHTDYGQLPEIECYPNQLNQVFMNVLVNAGQAIDDKGDIFITTRRDGDGIAIEIRDSGRGIPKDKLERIFDPGFTTKGVGVGTGLGLSIAHQIIDAHGGTIAAKSEVGVGTTFTITLPKELPERKDSTPPRQ